MEDRIKSTVANDNRIEKIRELQNKDIPRELRNLRSTLNTSPTHSQGTEKKTIKRKAGKNIIDLEKSSEIKKQKMDGSKPLNQEELRLLADLQRRQTSSSGANCSADSAQQPILGINTRAMERRLTESIG